MLKYVLLVFRLPVHSLFTLKDQFIAFAGSIHVVIMDIKKKEQHVGYRVKIFDECSFIFLCRFSRVIVTTSVASLGATLGHTWPPGI